MEDTICAISTSQGIGAISIVRVSGPEAISIVNKIFKGKENSKTQYGTGYHPELSLTGYLGGIVLMLPVLCPVDQHTSRIANRCNSQNQDGICSIPVHIKIIAGN